MTESVPAIDLAIREIARLLAAAYLRLRFPAPATALDSPETESGHVTGG